jgi:hypothetical protein
MPAKPKPRGRRLRRVCCHACGVREGEVHRRGCTAEVCPGCGAQALGHRCRRAAGLPRVPFLHFPSLCARCGTVNPRWFGVPDAVWTYYLPPYEREAVLCRPCFQTIVRLIDRHRPRPDWLPTEAEIATYAALWARFQRSPLRGRDRWRLATELDALDAAYAARRRAAQRKRGTS